MHQYPASTKAGDVSSHNVLTGTITKHSHSTFGFLKLLYNLYDNCQQMKTKIN